MTSESCSTYPINLEFIKFAQVTRTLDTTFKKKHLTIYPVLIANGIKILKYSGDTDAVVSTLGTQRWLDKMALPVVKEWR